MVEFQECTAKAHPSPVGGHYVTKSSILGYMQQILPSSVAFQYVTGLMASRNSHEHAPAASEVHFERRADLCTRAAIAAAGHD